MHALARLRMCTDMYYSHFLNSLSIEKQTTKFSSANFQKKIKSKLYHIEYSKTRGQTV